MIAVLGFYPDGIERKKNMHLAFFWEEPDCRGGQSKIKMLSWQLGKSGIDSHWWWIAQFHPGVTWARKIQMLQIHYLMYFKPIAFAT